MSLIREIIAELVGMFLSDLRLSLGILAVVAVAAAVREFAPDANTLVAGLVLLAGCVIVLASAVFASARGRR